MSNQVAKGDFVKCVKGTSRKSQSHTLIVNQIYQVGEVTSTGNLSLVEKPIPGYTDGACYSFKPERFQKVAERRPDEFVVKVKRAGGGI